MIYLARILVGEALTYIGISKNCKQNTIGITSDKVKA